MSSSQIGTTEKVKGGVQSVEIGMRLLKALSTAGGSATLNDLSETVGIPPAKSHRYLVSLIQSGFVEKSAPGRYDLGPYVLEFATSYLSRLEPTTIANETMEKLWSETEEGIILCVWGGSGTTVIRWLQSRRPISVGIRPGTVFSTTMSASGRVFLTYLPEARTRRVVEEELREHGNDSNPLAVRSMDDLGPVIEETRHHRMARVEGHSIEYVSALAAPVFDYRGEVVLSLALFGFKSDFDVSWEGRNARLLERAAAGISERLGYVG